MLIEQSVLGWKEYELEVMRDRVNNFVVVCSIENLDPMGVHTGDSITVAPAQTLTDREYQRLRDMARIVMQTVGVETGGSNVQFAVNPQNGEVIDHRDESARQSIIGAGVEGHRLSRSRRLRRCWPWATPSTRFPTTSRASRPPRSNRRSITAWSRFRAWNFEKFPGADVTLGPQMKSIGEVMAIGRTFPEALNKAFRGLDIGVSGFRRLLREGKSADSADLTHADGATLFTYWIALRNGAIVGRSCRTDKIRSVVRGADDR